MNGASYALLYYSVIIHHEGLSKDYIRLLHLWGSVPIYHNLYKLYATVYEYIILTNHRVGLGLNSISDLPEPKTIFDAITAIFESDAREMRNYCTQNSDVNPYPEPSVEYSTPEDSLGSIKDEATVKNLLSFLDSYDDTNHE